jgi:hypothetical protein
LLAPVCQAADVAESATPLRWQARPLSGERTSVPPAPAAARRNEPLRTGWNVTRIDAAVRPVQAIGPDPFRDPFGDRQAAHEDTTLELQPTQAEVPVETLPPPRAIAPTRPAPQRAARAPRMESTSGPLTPELIAAQQPPAGPVPGAAAPLPAPNMLAPDRPAVPCDRIYNDRNCCDAETNCTDFRNRLLTDSIRNISLDITPRYSPNLTPEEDLAERTERLRLLELRQWRDRRGQVRATGKMTRVEKGFVVIADENDREIARLLINELADDELCYINAWWRLPIECSLGGLRVAERNWIPSTFVWHASALCHKPLYFEEVQLERYGHTAGPIRQPFISGAHFFGSLFVLPYKMAISPPHECEYALGYYRPGSCAPWMIPPIPLSFRGAAAETAAVLGAIHLIP